MNNLNENKKKFAMGWIMVVCCMLIQAIPFGVANNIQPQFVPYIIEKFNFSLGQFSLIFTIGTIISAIASPFIGVMFNKVNAKIMFLIGCIFVGGGFAGFSICQTLIQFYLVAGIVQIGNAIISSIGMPLLINKWFDDSVKGKALGLAFAGGSLGNVFLQTITPMLLTKVGTSKSYLIFGLAALVVGVPISLLFIRLPKNESEIVKSKNNNEELNNSEDVNEIAEPTGLSFKEATSSKVFWILGVGLFFLGMYVSALAVQFPTYLKMYLKFDPVVVGTIGSIFAASSLLGNLFGGVTFDKLGPIKTLFTAFALALTSCISLMFAGQMPILAKVFAVCSGLSTFAYLIGPSILTGAFFGQKDFGTILGVVQIFFAVGFSAGSSTFGALVDKFNYGTAWTSVAVFIVLTYTLLISAGLIAKKTNKKAN